MPSTLYRTRHWMLALDYSTGVGPQMSNMSQARLTSFTKPHPLPGAGSDWRQYSRLLSNRCVRAHDVNASELAGKTVDKLQWICCEELTDNPRVPTRKNLVEHFWLIPGYRA